MYTSSHFNLFNYEVHHLEKCSITSACSVFTNTPERKVVDHLAVRVLPEVEQVQIWTPGSSQNTCPLPVLFIRSVCHRHSLPGCCQISGQNPYNQKGHLKLLVFMNSGCHFCHPSLRIHGKHKKDDSMVVVMTCDLYQGSTLFLSGRLLKSINLNLPLNNYP